MRPLSSLSLHLALLCLPVVSTLLLMEGPPLPSSRDYGNQQQPNQPYLSSQGASSILFKKFPQQIGLPIRWASLQVHWHLETSLKHILSPCLCASTADKVINHYKRNKEIPANASLQYTFNHWISRNTKERNRYLSRPTSFVDIKAAFDTPCKNAKQAAYAVINEFQLPLQIDENGNLNKKTQQFQRMRRGIPLVPVAIGGVTSLAGMASFFSQTQLWAKISDVEENIKINDVQLSHLKQAIEQVTRASLKFVNLSHTQSLLTQCQATASLSRDIFSQFLQLLDIAKNGHT